MCYLPIPFNKLPATSYVPQDVEQPRGALWSHIRTSYCEPREFRCFHSRTVFAHVGIVALQFAVSW
jgi:hypothetical protein